VGRRRFVAYSYTGEKDKALYITIQWCFTEEGSTIAALVALGINIHANDSTSGAPTPVYVVFIVIQVFAMVIALTCLVHPSKVTRSDGTHIAVSKQPTVNEELRRVAAIFTDWKFMMLLPAIFVAEVALALESSVNGYFFNLRPGPLNNVMFNFIQIPASIGMTWILDSTRFGRRRTRALIGFTIMSAVTLGICSTEAAWLSQKKINRNESGPSTDWEDSAFAGAFVICHLWLCLQVCLPSFFPQEKIYQHLRNIYQCDSVRNLFSHE
jgi:hypothetical protein